MFWWICLATNIANSKTMTFQTGAIQLGLSDEVFGKCRTGEGATYRERLRRPVLFPYCGVMMTVGYLIAHRRSLHGTNMVIDWEILPVI